MRGRSDIISSLQHMSIAREHMESFSREYPGTKGANMFSGYVKRINWIFNDLFTNPFLPDNVREGIKREVESDCMAVPAIAEKIALLNPAQRDVLEDVIDRIISGEDLIVDDIKV